MDARWWSLFGHRPETLKNPDVPKLARAIVAYMRRLPIQVYAGEAHNVTYVAFLADKNSFSVVIRGDDWAKIVPFLKSDALSPPSEPTLPWYNLGASLANIDVYDSEYYQKVLGVLNGLFPQTFPTSYL